jgi:nucleotide-binding universal stress UspA family protein
MAGRFTHILVPTDFNPASDAALEHAKELALKFDARLSLLHVVTDPRATGVWTPDVYVPASQEMRDRFLREAQRRLADILSPEEGARFSVTLEARIGAVAPAILDYAVDRNVDLIVMGTHGRTGLSHMLLGSVAERIIRTAPCPVLTAHAGREALAEAVSERAQTMPA